MPRSVLGELRKQREAEKNRFKKTVRKEAIQVWNEAINYTYKELYDEAWKMYDTFINQFYAYKTKSYIRHGETKPGTGMGSNLYRGQQITLKPGFNPSLSIEFSGEDMEKYRHNSTDEVLKMVMSGIRGVPSKRWWTTWKGSYNGTYFSFSGEMINAFNTFENYFYDIANVIFSKKLDNINKSGRFIYF